jgi:hypothetical protein
MKARTDSPKGVRGDSATFVDFMLKLIAVPHSEIKAQAEAEEERKQRLFGPSSRDPGAASATTPSYGPSRT